MASPSVVESCPSSARGVFALRNEGDLALGNIRRRTGTSGREFDNPFAYSWDSFFASVRIAIQEGFATTGQGIDIFVFEPPKAYEEITEAVSTYPVVALDPLYPDYIARKQERNPIQVLPLRTSRWFLPGTRTTLGINRRPVFPPIPEQLVSIRKAIGENDVVLLEDDGYTLKTVTEVVGAMRRDRINVREVFLGMKSGGKVELDVPITAVVSFDNRELVDMMDGRNGLLGAYAAGAVISFLEDGTVGRWPYIPPLVDPTVRISLPPEAVSQYTRNIIEANINFYDKIGELTGRPITLANTSFSFRVGLQHAIPQEISPDTPMQTVSQVILKHLENTNFAVHGPSSSSGTLFQSSP